LKHKKYQLQFVHFLVGFVSWFVLQSIYNTIAFRSDSTFLFIASIPVSLVTVLVIYLFKQRWIAWGAGAAIILNAIGLVMMAVFGAIDDETYFAKLISFPPFFLLFFNWVAWY
jgi:hypothetical protein